MYRRFKFKLWDQVIYDGKMAYIFKKVTGWRNGWAINVPSMKRSVFVLPSEIKRTKKRFKTLPKLIARHKKWIKTGVL